MNKTLLLDVDGVLIRDKVLLDHVRYNSSRYVAKKLQMSKDASITNYLLYKAYGHTAIGLKKEYGIDSSDFNSFVYDTNLIGHLSDFLEFSNEFKKDVKTIRKILSMGYNVELFSNAPLIWTEPVRHAIDSSKIGNGVYSKPNIDSYLGFKNTNDYIFVDDKICNLLPSLFFKNWTPVHFSEYKENTFIQTLDSLELLSLALEY